MSLSNRIKKLEHKQKSERPLVIVHRSRFGEVPKTNKRPHVRGVRLIRKVFNGEW